MFKFTDAHVHFGKRENFDEYVAIEQLKKEMFKNYIQKIFIFTIKPIMSENLKMYRAINNDLEHFIPFLYLNPLNRDSLDNCKELLTKYHFKGIKLHPYACHFKIDDFFLLDPWMNIASQYNCHVIVHCTSQDEYCSPLQLERLAKRYPQLTFQMAHMGAIWQCSEAIEIIKRNNNIYADTSIVSYSAVKRASKQIPDKLLIGTDYPFYKFEIEQLKIKLACQETSELSKIMYENFNYLVKKHNY